MPEMKVPFHDLALRYAGEREEILACIDRVLARGHVFLSEEVDEFEAAICRYTGAQHCVSLNSGTDALMIGLWALGIGKADQVITSPVSFIASAGAIAHIGAVPVSADVLDDQNIDPAAVERKISSRTKAIMPVHWTGRIADMNAINVIAKSHGLKVIEDAAQAMGARYQGCHGGTLADCGAVSAHPHKILSALGDGGFLLTGDLGVQDEDGYFWYVSREDDVITTAGYRVGPSEIEHTLMKHPAVAMSAVVGIPDPIRTESIKAWIVLRPGFAPDEALAREIQDFVKVQLAAHEYPRFVQFTDTLPMTATGKVLRRELRTLG